MSGGTGCPPRRWSTAWISTWIRAWGSLRTHSRAKLKPSRRRGTPYSISLMSSLRDFPQASSSAQGEMVAWWYSHIYWYTKKKTKKIMEETWRNKHPAPNISGSIPRKKTKPQVYGGREQRKGDCCFLGMAWHALALAPSPLSQRVPCTIFTADITWDFSNIIP